MNREGLLTFRIVVLCLLFALGVHSHAQTAASVSNSFMNFETAPVHPIALSPDGSTLAVCNLNDGKLEIFDVTSGDLIFLGMVAVGIDPVSVRFRNNGEAWVVNQISDSISVVDTAGLRVITTIDTLDTPADVVFAGSPQRAFVSCALPNTIEVFDPGTRHWVTNVLIKAERPKALAVSPDGQQVYAAIFESGNATTVVGGKFRNLLFFDNAVSLTNGPYGGQNPPPNNGANFSPPITPALIPISPPLTGLIVRKNSAARWLDDNQHDWTEFVSGESAPLTQRVTGWDLPDRDLAIIDTRSNSVTYATGLMNLCMALAVNPASGRIAVVGTDALNEVRFEPNLNGIFVRVKLALVNPLSLTNTVKDLNPHLDYTIRTLPPGERDKSIGDPRGIVWTADGTRGYVAGMGSRNLVVIDADGNRLSAQPIELGEGPCGLALDETRQRLYVFNRFSSSVSVVETVTNSVINAVPLFDPTPLAIAAGRRHLYDTRRTSGLGQASCASCHPDGRMDRLGWDLGNPAGEMSNPVVNSQGTFVTNSYHPMKGVMITQTLQDIIGHEPFHWRGDRVGIEAFNPTFTNLQGAATALNSNQMRELRDFLSSIRLPPNPFRGLDNSLPVSVPLNGHVALGENLLPFGAPLPVGNAVTGLALFSQPNNFCFVCHTLPTGVGIDGVLQQNVFQPIPIGPNGEHHFPLAPRLEGSLRSKIAQFRNLAERIGMDGTRTESRAGFGFGHDGSVDSMTRFLNGVRVIRDQDVADFIALLLSVSGSDTGGLVGAGVDLSPPSGVGRQLTVNSGIRPALLNAMLALAASSTSRVDLIAKGPKDGLARGWSYDRARDLFQSDRQQETASPDQLLALAGAGNEITFTIVPRGSGVRLGIDRDLDGLFDRDELDAGANPSDRTLLPRIIPPFPGVAVGTDLVLEPQIPPLPAPLISIIWTKEGQPIPGGTNAFLTIPNVQFADSGDYVVVVSTLFQSSTSAPLRVVVAPLTVTVSPASQEARRGSNALFTAAIIGTGPFQYQWEFNRQALPGFTTSSWGVSNAQVADEGVYRLRVTNPYGSVTSAPVNLFILADPVVVIPPLSQSVVAGANATFSLLVSGHPPPFGYQLRKSTFIVTNYSSVDPAGFLTLFNVQSTNAGTYRIVVTNAANPSGLSLDPVTLTVLLDSDHDGLPDEWEAAHGLGTNNAADAQIDSDLDGQTNWQEYIAGTDPRDPQSYLKVDRILTAHGGTAAVIQFNAVSNKTYTVQSRDSLEIPDAWTKVADLLAFPTNRLASITNALDGAISRYYRLVTPRIP